MNRWLQLTGVGLALAAPCQGNEATPTLRVTSDGGTVLQPAQGSCTWFGALEIGHPRFQLKAQGQATLYGGPSIHAQPDAIRSLRKRVYAVEQQWISLVILGEIEIRVVTNDGLSRPIKARRVVYLPAEDRLLLDGKTRVADQRPPR